MGDDIYGKKKEKKKKKEVVVVEEAVQKASGLGTEAWTAWTADYCHC